MNFPKIKNIVIHPIPSKPEIYCEEITIPGLVCSYPEEKKPCGLSGFSEVSHVDFINRDTRKTVASCIECRGNRKGIESLNESYADNEYETEYGNNVIACGYLKQEKGANTMLAHDYWDTLRQEFPLKKEPNWKLNSTEIYRRATNNEPVPGVTIYHKLKDFHTNEPTGMFGESQLPSKYKRDITILKSFSKDEIQKIIEAD